MTFDSHRMKPNLCPQCGDKLDMATHPKGDVAPPTEGDFSMCLNCGAILRWVADFDMKVATPEDMAELPEEERKLLTHMQTLRRSRIPPGGIPREESKH